MTQLSEKDWIKLCNQITYGKPSKRAAQAIEEGRKIAKEFQKNGGVVEFRLSPFGRAELVVSDAGLQMKEGG